MSAPGKAPLRVIFAGTPEFARLALERIHAAGHTVCLVLTQPDRPAGRGMQLQASAVKQFAQQHGMAVAQPRSLRLDGAYAADAAQAQQALAQADADVMIVAAYGLILPKWVLETMAAPRLGCLNIHGSILPRWRGAAPIHRAIEAGDAQTGVTIMQMDEGLDTGDMLLVQALPITDSDTTATLHDKVAALGADLIVQALDALQQGPLPARVQPTQGVSYAHKISRQEAAIDWTMPAHAIGRKVRAFNPFPGSVMQVNGETIKVWRAQPLEQATRQDAIAGSILDVSVSGIAVACGEGVLLLQELQRAGGKRLCAADFLRGFALQPGAQLGSPGAETA